jgi:hypothetical protein
MLDALPAPDSNAATGLQPTQYSGTFMQESQPVAHGTFKLVALKPESTSEVKAFFRPSRSWCRRPAPGSFAAAAPAQPGSTYPTRPRNAGKELQPYRH